MDKEELRLKEEETMAQLKDFQCATVERIDELFRSGQNRVLVADEVGLGKTLIARGVIIKTAINHFEKDCKDLFKIVYICSNQVIANQNIQKLDVFDIRPDKNNNGTRLSMQHLRIAEQELDTKTNGDFAQLIPLTPSTSFNMTNSGGSQDERALMFAIIKRIDVFKGHISDISELFSRGVKDWDYFVDDFDSRINKLKFANTGYPENVINEIVKYDLSHNIFDSLIQFIQKKRNNEENSESVIPILKQFRKMFAQISTDMFHPDFVIMDEFQRFKNLIDPKNQETDNGVIAKKFFETAGLNVLLLSATPYKLYSTMEEIESAASPDEFYREFFQVTDFLANDNEKRNHFNKVWSNYSTALRELVRGDSAVLQLKKNAEDEMYGLMCRTERISAMDSGDYIDDSSTHRSLCISEGDIHTYMDMGKMLRDIEANGFMLVDFAKSSPYLMSYMSHYKVKEKVEAIAKNNADTIVKMAGKYLWLDRKTIENYQDIPSNNARLEELKRQIFYNRSELYMWVPPSKPYYNLEGVYKDSKGFSKVIVFSSWEMVPRMIGSLISYEEEKRTVGVLSKQRTVNNTYFTEASKRYPSGRLNFRKKEARGMYLFCLLYPSETLAEIYNPIEYINAKCSLTEIRDYLQAKLKDLLQPVIDEYEHDSDQEDRKWYYMAPILLDGKEYVNDWIRSLSYYDLDDLDDADDEDSADESGKSGFEVHLNRLKSLMENAKRELGKVPDDLYIVLSDMAIGSFAICAYRVNGGDPRMASELARVFIKRFNSTEATAAVMLSYSEGESSERAHWRNVLKYCCDGGFGAMLDEFVHMFSEGTGFGLSEDKNRHVHEMMMNALKIHTASYEIDTYPAFEKRMKGEKCQGTKMRSHFAVGFTKGDGRDENVNRKDDLRNAFNSPMRPFVLATTSIGQEGLDFHYYCRKIMHWNLPNNPIDIEQREGRINRYKCLAIRQEIAEHFSDKEFVSDVWRELFEFASQEIRMPNQSELVPYWCLGRGQKVKIERIIPMYPVSRDEVKYQRLKNILAVYRLTLGQARQEELVDYLLENGIKTKENLRQYFINLSPYERTDVEWRKRINIRVKKDEEKKKTWRQERIESLKKEIKNIEELIGALSKKKDSQKDYDVIGMPVVHKFIGRGEVKNRVGNYIYVDFPDRKNSEFSFPEAFKGGILESENPDFLDAIIHNSQIKEELDTASEELCSKKAELKRLMI